MLKNKLRLDNLMPDKKKILLLVATILSVFVTLTIIIKSVVKGFIIQEITTILVGSGTTFEALGVNINLAYLAITLSIIVGVITILGGLLSFKEFEVRDIKIGPILLLAMAIFLWIGIYIPLIETSFYAGSYIISMDFNLLETLIGIGEPIILTLAAILALIAIYVISE